MVRHARTAFLAAVLGACGGAAVEPPRAADPAPSPAVARDAESPSAPFDCRDPGPLHRHAYVGIHERPDLGIADKTIAEADTVGLRATERRLGVRSGELDDCTAEGDCYLSAAGSLRRVVPGEGERCARGVVEIHIGWETPIGIYVPVASRRVLLEVDGASPDSIRLVRELEDADPELREGPVVGDLDGDGREDELRVRMAREEACFGYAFDTNECQGCGVPAAVEVEVRDADGRALLTVPLRGRASDARLEAAIDRLERASSEPEAECPRPARPWFGLRPRGGAVVRRTAEGFALDRTAERVRCGDWCVTPLGDVCTTEPDPEYQVSSPRCVSEGVFLETWRVAGGRVERTERALPGDGAIATVAAEGCDESCRWRALPFGLVDARAEPRRIGASIPEGAIVEHQGTGAALRLPTGTWAVELTRSGAPETWQVIVTAETTDLALPR